MPFSVDVQEQIAALLLTAIVALHGYSIFYYVRKFFLAGLSLWLVIARGALFVRLPRAFGFDDFADTADSPGVRILFYLVTLAILILWLKGIDVNISLRKEIRKRDKGEEDDGTKLD